MRITSEDLKRVDACSDGIDAFVERYPDGLDLTPWTREKQIELLTSDPFLREYFSWAVRVSLIPAWSMYGANLSGTDLSKAKLAMAELGQANLHKADLSGAFLYRANLFGANLSNANLVRADLYGANLCGADLSGADLAMADLSQANLRGANLSEANLNKTIRFPKQESDDNADNSS